MSMMCCKKCGCYINTDNPEDGVWVNEMNKPDYRNTDGIFCLSCAEDQFTWQELEKYNA